MPVVFLFVMLLLVPLPALAVPEGLERGESGTVATVIDGDTLALESGTQVRLVGLQAPKLPLGRPDYVPWPLANEARAALQALVLGRQVSLWYGGARTDRYGRALAHVFVGAGEAEELWVQAELLGRGMARVYSFADNRTLVPEMLAIEAAAILNETGIWGDAFYRIKSGDDVFGLVDTFQIVEARVMSAAIVRGRAYLNFGENYRTDFTVTIPPAAIPLFAAENIEIEAMAGRQIRVRGWIQFYNGPNIELTHPEELQVLED